VGLVIRSMTGLTSAVSEVRLDDPLGVLVELRDHGLIRRIGLPSASLQMHARLGGTHQAAIRRQRAPSVAARIPSAYLHRHVTASGSAVGPSDRFGRASLCSQLEAWALRY
jgi:hypothetical protein